MENKPKVSVVVTTYDRIECLVRAVDSVLRQTHDNIELIVINDCAKQNSEVESVLADYPALIFHSNSSGANEARLLGFNNSSGDFICFLDDDDYWHESKIAIQLETFKRYEHAVLVTSNGLEVFEDNTSGATILTEAKRKLIPYGNFLGGYSFPMIRRNKISTSYFKKGLESGQDWFLYIRLSEDHPDGGFLHTNTREIYYQKSKFSISSSSEKRFKGYMKIFSYLEGTMKIDQKLWHRYYMSKNYNNAHVESVSLFRLLVESINSNNLKLLLRHLIRQKIRRIVK